MRSRAVAVVQTMLAVVSLVGTALVPPPANAQNGIWKAVTPPTGRNQHTAIYDPVRDHMLIFGGNGDNVARRDLWALTLAAPPTWVPLMPTIAPIPRRWSHSAIYDPVRDRMIVFGGKDGLFSPTIYQDTWAVGLAGVPTWTQLSPSGTPPSARFGHSAIYDPIRDRMIVFGGGATLGPTAEVWALTLSATPSWTQLTPAGPPPPVRSDHSAIYDPAGDRMIIFGGTSGDKKNDVWALTLAGTPTWSQLAPSGGPPPGRFGHAAILQPSQSRMIVYGGNETVFGNDAWALALSPSLSWTQLTPANPPDGVKDYTSGIYDSARDRMLTFGIAQFGTENDVQGLSLGTPPAWSLVSPGVFGPRVRDDLPSAAYDSNRNRLTVFGGNQPSTVDAAALNAFSAGPPPQWTLLFPSNQPPIQRVGCSVVYYQALDAIVVFGGADAFTGDVLKEIWKVTPGTPPVLWTNVTPASTPAALVRSGHSAIYDPPRHRMVVFGGSDPSNTQLGDTWSIDLTVPSPTWTLLNGGGGAAPSARTGHTAIYDPGSDRMMVFGGPADANVYAMKLSAPAAWVAAYGDGADANVPRSNHAAVYDLAYHRMLVFGGLVGLSYTNDVHAFNLDPGVSFGWHQLTPAGNPPSPHGFVTGAYIPTQGQMQIFGGFDGSFDNNVMALEFPEVLAVEPRGGGATLPSLRLLRNPAHGGMDLEIGGSWLNRSGTLRIVDLQGRTVWRHAVGGSNLQSAQGERIHWDGRDLTGDVASPGVYFALVEGDVSQSVRFILLR